MNSNVIYRLLDMALTLAEQEMEDGGTADTVLHIIHKAEEVYEEQTGMALNTSFIEAEEEL